jgi:hypothetical protein
MVYNGYYKVMANIPKMGPVPTPVPSTGASKDPGMVSSTGNGRRYAAQALVRSVQESRELELTAVLVYATGPYWAVVWNHKITGKWWFNGILMGFYSDLMGY